MTTKTAAVDSPTADGLALLASWAATQDTVTRQPGAAVDELQG